MLREVRNAIDFRVQSVQILLQKGTALQDFTHISRVVNQVPSMTQKKAQTLLETFNDSVILKTYLLQNFREVQ